MKKTVVSLGVAAAVGLAFAGGKAAPALPKVVEIKSPCTVEKVYVEPNTNLMWQDAPYTNAEDGAQAQDTSFGKAGSLMYAMRYCHTLNYAGYNDWRLPTADELMRVHKIDGQVFTNFRDKDFWSSTPTTDGKYYVVYPADAYKYKRKKTQSNFIRCVRCTVEDDD